MKFMPIRAHGATIVHGWDDAPHEITENCQSGLAALTKQPADARPAPPSKEGDVMTSAAASRSGRAGGQRHRSTERGSLIAAGLDAAAVLAGLGHLESEVVVTLDLSVRFVHLAHADATDEFAARPVDPPFATPTAMVAPACPKARLPAVRQAPAARENLGSALAANC